MQVSVNTKIEKDVVTNGDLIQHLFEIKNIKVMGALVFVEFISGGEARFDLDWWDSCCVHIR